MATTYETYTVQAGDTLVSIAVKLWGDKNRWNRLADANAITAPYTLRAGQKLLVPVTYLPTIPITKGVSVNVWPLLMLVAVVVLLYLKLRGTRRG